MNGLAQVYGGWIRRYGIDGFRVDTAKHVDRAFFGAWLPKIRAAARAAGIDDFEVFGEVFETDAIELSGYVRDRGLPNVIDFPLQDSLDRFAGGSAGARGVATRPRDDDYFRGPSGIAPTPPTFLGNHDTGRGARMVANQAFGATDAELQQRVLFGYSLLYLLRGAPVVMYGDEVGMMGSGGDKAARQDMFPTQVRDWQVEKRWDPRRSARARPSTSPATPSVSSCALSAAFARPTPRSPPARRSSASPTRAARGQPDRPRGATGVPGGVQQRLDRSEADRAHGHAVGVVGVALRRGRCRVERRRRARDGDDPAPQGAALRRRLRSAGPGRAGT